MSRTSSAIPLIGSAGLGLKKGERMLAPYISPLVYFLIGLVVSFIGMLVWLIFVEEEPFPHVFIIGLVTVLMAAAWPAIFIAFVVTGIGQLTLLAKKRLDPFIEKRRALRW